MYKLIAEQKYYQDEDSTFPGFKSEFYLGDNNQPWDRVLEAFLHSLNHCGYMIEVDEIMVAIHDMKTKRGLYFMENAQ